MPRVRVIPLHVDSGNGDLVLLASFKNPVVGLLLPVPLLLLVPMLPLLLGRVRFPVGVPLHRCSIVVLPHFGPVPVLPHDLLRPYPDPVRTVPSLGPGVRTKGDVGSPRQFFVVELVPDNRHRQTVALAQFLGFRPCDLSFDYDISSTVVAGVWSFYITKRVIPLAFLVDHQVILIFFLLFLLIRHFLQPVGEFRNFPIRPYPVILLLVEIASTSLVFLKTSAVIFNLLKTHPHPVVPVPVPTHLLYPECELKKDPNFPDL